MHASISSENFALIQLVPTVTTCKPHTAFRCPLSPEAARTQEAGLLTQVPREAGTRSASSKPGKNDILPGRTGRQPPPVPERVSAPSLPAQPGAHPAPAGQARPWEGGRHALWAGSQRPQPPAPSQNDQCPSPGPQIPPPWELRWHPHLQARAARPSDFCSELPQSASVGAFIQRPSQARRWPRARQVLPSEDGDPPGESSQTIAPGPHCRDTQGARKPRNR